MSGHATPVTYQTVKLSRGKHHFPHEGVCVMELASMIAGEPFTDQPLSVCPVIAAFLRTYNDAIDDARRQDLYRYAAVAIGTQATWRIQQQRIVRCLAWGEQMLASRSRLRRLLAPVKTPRGSDLTAAAAGSYAARAITRHTEDTHARALAFIEDLCAMTATPARGARRPVGSPAGDPGRAVGSPAGDAGRAVGSPTGASPTGLAGLPM